MSTRKLGSYATREEFLESEVRTLNFYIQSMIETMKVTSMNRQYMSEELERMKQEIEGAVLAEREACAKVCEETDDGTPYNLAEECARKIRARGQA
jgi:hypothetical protein